MRVRRSPHSCAWGCRRCSAASQSSSTRQVGLDLLSPAGLIVFVQARLTKPINKTSKSLLLLLLLAQLPLLLVLLVLLLPLLLPLLLLLLPVRSLRQLRAVAYIN